MNNIPPGFGICPVCNSTKQQKLSPYDYKNHKDQTHKPCLNCGGQYMYGTPTGFSPINKEGNPCHHVYKITNKTSTYRIYSCVNCSLVFDIDSGD